MTPTKTTKCAIAAAWYQQTGIRLPKGSSISIRGDGGTLHTRRYGDIYFLRACVGPKWNFPAYMYCWSALYYYML